MTNDMDIDLEIEADEVAYIYLGTDKHNNLKNLDLPDSHPIRAITGLQEVVDKVGRTEDGAEINRIIGVRVNGTPLDIAEDRTVDVPVPTSYGYYLDLDGNNGVISLKDRDGVVLSTIDTNLERIVKSGRYDANTNELVLVLDDNSEIRIDASKLVDVYTADGETIVETGHVFALSKGSKDALNDSKNHIADRSNPHHVTKDQVGLSNVDNTSDMSKPISTLMQQALDGKANDDAVVHKSGDTMTGALNIRSGYPNITLINSGSTGANDIVAKDSASKLGILRFKRTDTFNSIELVPITFGTDSLATGMAVYSDANGVTCNAVTPSNNADNSIKIATTEWVNKASTLVHTTGNETIAGTKTFTAPPIVTTDMVLIGKKSDYDLTVLPSYRVVQYIPFRDKNNVTNTQIESVYDTSGAQSLLFSMRNRETAKWTYFGLNHDRYGDYGTAPATDDAHPDNAIVTKKYLLDKIAFSKQPYVVAYNPAVAITNPTSCITYQGRCASYVKPAMSNNVLDRGSWTDDEPLLKRIQYCTFRPDGTIKEVLYKNDLTKVWIKNFAENVPDTPIYTNDELMQYCATLTQPSEIPPDAAESSIITLDTMVVIPTLYTYGDERGFRISLDPSQGEAEAHTIDGEVCKYIAIGVYLGTVKDDKLMSVSQAEPLRSTSRYNFRAKLIGKDETHGKWRLLTYWDSRLLKMLTVLIGGSMDGQVTFGNGLITAMGVDSTSTTDIWTRNYATYTGKTDKVGMFGQSAEFTQKFDVDAYGKYDNGSTVVNRQVKCLVEAPWGQCWQFADDHCNEPSTGRLFAGKNSAKVIHPLDNNSGQYFTNQVASPTLIEHICTITDPTDGLPGQLTEAKKAYSDVIHTESAAWGLPAVKAGSSSTGTCDGWWMLSRSSAGVKNNIVGGSSAYASGCGPFTWSGYDTLSWASVSIGARPVFVFN